MAFLGKTSNILKKFKRNESGMTALTWSLSVSVMLFALGGAVDMSAMAKAKRKSQSIADTTALAAAIHIRNHGQIPENRHTGLTGPYSANELGFDYSNWVVGGADGVDINVLHDDIKRQATVTVMGVVEPMFLKIANVSAINFSAKSIVKYEEIQPLDPASIVLILDNSGSMAFDDLPIDSDGNAPDKAQRRMDGLQTSAKNFMTILEEHVGDQDGSTELPRVLRTGMLAFDDQIITARTAPMDWGTISAGEIDYMEPLQATNSAPPLIEAGRWLNDLEPSFHAAESPGKTPLKYIILMTDGKNSGDLEWVAREGTESWRAWKVVGTRTEYRDETTTSTQRQVVNQYISNANCKVEGGYKTTYYWYNGRRYYTSRRVLCDVETSTTVQVPYEVNEYDWVFRYGEEEPTETGNWEEGEFDVPANVQSRAECDELHASGVEIFTIGYALVPGQFETNEWADRPGAYTPYPKADEPDWYEDSVKSTNLAKGMLQYCASRDENFITADDAPSLEAAFQKIGNSIVKEIIRISS